MLARVIVILLTRLVPNVNDDQEKSDVTDYDYPGLYNDRTCIRPN
jgi:hypothetical protein